MPDSEIVGATVLLVDDNRGDLLVAEGALDGLGLRVLTAASGPEALALLQDHDVAVAVLDVRMPGMDGFATARLIRKTERSGGTPIIFLTVARNESDMRAGYELGAVDFIVKPVVPLILRAKVAAFVELHRVSLEVARQAVLLVESERHRLEAERRVSELAHHEKRLELERQYREQLELSYAELKEVNAELAAAQERLDAMVRDKDRLIATVSHEMRTPLAGVLGFALELRDGLAGFTPVEITEFVGLIAQGCATAANLVDDLLVAARTGGGAMGVTPESTDLHSVINGVISSVEVAAPVGGKSITVGGEAAAAWADPRRIAQILRNLLVNAVRYGGDHIGVVVGARHATREAFVRVTDDGPGIPLKGVLFEAYQHGPQVPGRTESVGLGLYVSRSLARLMGGDLTYHREGGLSIFELSLPGQAPTSH
jgi:signal transduction histidine kinase